MSEEREKVLSEWSQSGGSGMDDDAFRDGWDARDSRVAELTAELTAERDRADKAESFIGLCGYRRCDAPACNCGSWHSGPNVRAEKAEARVAELEGALRFTKGVLEDDVSGAIADTIWVGLGETLVDRIEAALSGQAPVKP